MASWSVSLILVANYLLSVHQNLATIIECVTIIGDPSSAVGSTSTASCSNPYTLTSCGFRNINNEFLMSGGSYIINNTCYAKHQANSAGVRAYARCCNLSPYNLTCDTYQSSGTPINGGSDPDDDPTSYQCSSDQVLMGCTANTEGGIIDGCFLGKF